MVQRKGTNNKLGIHADHHHVKSDKRLASLNQDGTKTRAGADLKKKMKKSKSIKLSDMEILKKPSPPSKKSFVQVLHHHPTVSSSSSSSSSSSPQKLTPLIRTSDGSPNYMKPTSSSDAKKELFPVSVRNSNKSNSKSSSAVSAKKPAKTLVKSSPSLKLVRTLTKAPSFKKSSRVSLCAADMNSQRATCSSTLKDSKFPPYLMLNPGATESEGTSAMKVCPYTYCSLNGHHHAPLPPLKSFLSARRRLLKTQKSTKLEALSPRKLKVPCEPKKESDSDIDFFIEIYAKKNGDEEEIGQMGPTKMFEDEEQTQGDDGMKQVVASLSDGSPKSEIDSEDDYGKYFDDAEIEADSKRGGFLQEQEAEFEDEKRLPIWSGEEISIESYCSEVSYEGETNGSDSAATDMEWEHEADDADSSVLTEENDSKVESLSESSHDVSVMWLDDIINIYYENMVAEVSQESNAKEIICFEAQHHGTDESLELKEGHGGENETVMDVTVHTANFTDKIFEELEETSEQNPENSDVLEAENSMNKESLEQKNDEEDVAEKQFSPEEEPLVAETNNKMEEEDNADFKEEIVLNHVADTSQEHCCEASEVDSSQGQKASEPCETSQDITEDKGASNKRKWAAGRQKRSVQEEDEMRKFNPREPNFLDLAPDPEAEKVDLKHQMMDERKNAEEWMLDYAVRQTVTKLAPARKRKVALLVEAFESVIPMPKCETQMRNQSSFAHPRPIQACR